MRERFDHTPESYVSGIQANDEATLQLATPRVSATAVALTSTSVARGLHTCASAAIAGLRSAATTIGDCSTSVVWWVCRHSPVDPLFKGGGNRRLILRSLEPVAERACEAAVMESEA